MKLRNIIIGSAIAAASLTSCDDYLDVTSPAKFDYDYVYTNKNEINMALRGLYASLLSDNAYGRYLTYDLILNSDIDVVLYSSSYSGTNNWKRFDGDSDGAAAANLWKAMYAGIELCNIFIDQIKKSELYTTDDEEMTQMLGEAICIRSMLYHELVWYFGDIPFTLEPSYNINSEVFPVTDRTEVLDALIADLQSIAPLMQFAKNNPNGDGVERCSKEFAWAQVARLSLTAGGYTLRPDKNNPSDWGTMQRVSNYQDYYRTARTYCDSVMSSGTHALTKSYIDVFVDECNFTYTNTDDVIFEIPFTQDGSGTIGYYTGNTCSTSNSEAYYAWGGISGAQKISAAQRFLYAEGDVRRDYLFGFWTYSATTSTPSVSYSTINQCNNKWSKLWSNTKFGSTTTSSTGINYPYMRYADVLLMFAEADNELNGPTAEAQEAMRQVRERAFRGSSNASDNVDGYIAKVSADKDRFRSAILDERKFEFPGENMRWRDLVRNNLYGEAIYWAHLRAQAIATNPGAGILLPSCVTACGRYDTYGENEDIWEDIPSIVIYHKSDFSNLGLSYFPNNEVTMPHLWSLYDKNDRPSDFDTSSNYVYYGWFSDVVTSEGMIIDNLCYTYYGYIFTNSADNSYRTYVRDNGTLVEITDANLSTFSAATLPPVRYILPYPAAAIQDAAGAYTNYYGYKN